MLTIVKKMDVLTRAFANLSTSITFKCQQSCFDDNHMMEIILPKLLNWLYGLKLINLNIIKHNHPAIDLGDSTRQLAFQITSDGSRSKMVSTLDMLEKHNLNKTYKNIVFLIISNDQKINLQRQGYEISVMNLGDIANKIKYLEVAKFNFIYKFCEEQFSDYWGNTHSFLQPQALPTKDPNIDISNFMKFNKFTEPYIIPVVDIRNGLIHLNNVLSNLNEEQRWFIYKLMEYAIKFGKDKWFEYCIAPYEYMVSCFRNTEFELFERTAKTLTNMHIAYYHEDTWYYDNKLFGLTHRNQNNDYDFFCGICLFIYEKNDLPILEEIIMKCDFSHIN